jgi:hypothetical protein
VRLHPAVSRQTLVTRPNGQAIGRKTLPKDTIEDIPIQSPPMTCCGWLLVLGGHDRGRDHRLVSGRNIAGSSVKCPITLKGLFISRQHFAIETTGERSRLVDLDSTNGTFVNGIKVTQIDIHDGDLLQVGAIRLRYREAGPLDGHEAKSPGIHKRRQSPLHRR